MSARCSPRPVVPFFFVVLALLLLDGPGGGSCSSILVVTAFIPSMVPGRQLDTHTRSSFRRHGTPYSIRDGQVSCLSSGRNDDHNNEKLCGIERKTDVDPATANNTDWILPASLTALVLVLAVVLYQLYSTVFGLEQFWGSDDNGGLGTALSTQQVEELLRNEHAAGLEGMIVDEAGTTTTRSWENLSLEELREEQALLKIIQGQDLRTK